MVNILRGAQPRDPGRIEDRSMDENLISEATVTINASPSKVWEALTRPELIQQYLFGTR